MYLLHVGCLAGWLAGAMKVRIYSSGLFTLKYNNNNENTNDFSNDVLDLMV